MSPSSSSEKKRTLRLADPARAKSAKLFNFDSVNTLLYLDQPIQVDHSTTQTTDSLYRHYGSTCQLPKLAGKNTDLQFKATLLPRRQRIRTDPLDDAIYENFHRRMTKEEKSMAGVDRTRMTFEIENLRDQLSLLLQHDWVRQLPRITMINDRKNPEEMARKRSITRQEIQRLLNKYSNWEQRDARLQRARKRFEERSNGVSASRTSQNDESDESSDESDDNDDETVLSSLAKLKEERQRKRMLRDGLAIRIMLRNGYDILQPPEHSPRIVESDMYIR